MLKKTFLHIPGVSQLTEQRLWAEGLIDWDSALESRFKEHIKQSQKALQNNDHSYFKEMLPSKEHWRAYKHFSPCFLDIETTGLSKEYNDVTVIGLYDGQESKIFVNGQNFDEFPEEIKKYNMIISFNGICFDVPFLKSKFPNVDFNHLHADLRWLMKRLGYTGGLKRIEKELDITRGEEIAEVDGREAVRLWYRYKKGDEGALKTLIEYNKADIVNLKTLMDFTYDGLKNQIIK
jgi:uncharacterized protein